MYCAEITTLLIHDHDPHPELFDALLSALRGLNRGSIHPTLSHYQLALLTHTGYALQTHQDVLTAKPLAARAVLHFLPAQGGFTSATAADLAAITPPPDAWPVRGSTVTLLRTLLDAQLLPDASENLATDDASPHPEPDAPADHWSRAGRLLATFLCRLIESPPKTLPLVYPDATTVTTSPARRR
jgi:recombinational DNA repair protein (RecF pathway)